jgi:hypothetical protein
MQHLRRFTTANGAPSILREELEVARDLHPLLGRFGLARRG